MALASLITALKVVPWGDVIQATPGLVKNARKMFSRTEADVPAATPPVSGDPEARLRQLEQRLHEMAEREQAAAGVLKALAEQNAAVVQTVEILRARARWLVVLNAALLVLLAGGLALSYSRFSGG